MENQLAWHGMAPNDEQYALAMKELEEGIQDGKEINRNQRWPWR